MSPGSVMFVEKCSGRPQSNALYCQALLMVRLARAQSNSSWLNLSKYVVRSLPSCHVKLLSDLWH